MTDFNFRAPENQETQEFELPVMDLEPVAEESLSFPTIYDQMVYERSHDNPNYIDPVAAIHIIQKEVDRKINTFNQEMRVKYIDYAAEMKRLLLRNGPPEKSINERKQLVRRMWGKGL